MPIFAEFVGTQHLWDLFVCFTWDDLDLRFKICKMNEELLVGGSADAFTQAGKVEYWGKKDKTKPNHQRTPEKQKRWIFSIHWEGSSFQETPTLKLL